jgi:hypothetical protein
VGGAALDGRFRVLVLLGLALLPLAVVFKTFLLAVDFFAAFFFEDFLGVLAFCVRFFVLVAFARAVFFDLVDFFLVFFLVAMRAV